MSKEQKPWGVAGDAARDEPCMAHVPPGHFEADRRGTLTVR